MTDLVPIFERLGLRNYVERFVDEGFDSWETVLYITESDLEALSVKLGHRRKLQKEIASARGISIEQVITAGAGSASVDDTHTVDPESKSVVAGQGETKNSTSGPSKRKYRRHPKADENAPERAPSAYVIFSNKVREELRPQKLSFTKIAKTVGERWQELQPDEKEQYESQAAAAKEVYNAELARYKRTPQYRHYMRYLNDFKSKNAPNTTDGKRPRLETETSNASSASTSSLTLAKELSLPEHQRNDSLSQSGYSPTNSSMNSPTSSLPRFPSGPIETLSQSSHPATPVSAKQPGTNPNPQGQRGFEPPITQHLPRILPLEPREGTVQHRMSLINEPGSTFGTNPRRSGNNSPAAFLRHDTSKSSNSSNISGVSGTSSTLTPITPIDDFRPGRSLPLPLNLLAKAPSTGQSLVDLPRPLGTAPVGPKTVGEHASGTLNQPGYAQSFHHLSIVGNNTGDDRRPRSQSVQNDQQQMSPTRPISTHHVFQAPNQADHMQTSRYDPNIQEPVSRMDSLSVLALAGRMVDQPYERPER